MVSIFFLLFFLSFWCAREWPNFTCIEFYLLKDIKRISIFTVAVVLAFFGFHSCVFVCLSVCLFCICFENNEKRVKQKNELTKFTFFSWILVSYSHLYQLESYACTFAHSGTHHVTVYFFNTLTLLDFLQ